MAFEDHFSAVAGPYAEFRPRYPAALIDHIVALCERRERAWDCACGSGQATLDLAERFAAVIATDASAAQIAAAPAHPRVSYRVAPAEDSGIESASLDLVVVAQALHWFDVERFHREAARVLRSGGVIAVWSYGLFSIEDAAIDDLVRDLYWRTLGAYWPPERRHIENGYRDLSFPYELLPAPSFDFDDRWSLAHLLGFLRSWSATRRYREERGEDPIAAFGERVAPLWGDATSMRRVVWPLTVRLGRMGRSPPTHA